MTGGKGLIVSFIMDIWEIKNWPCQCVGYICMSSELNSQHFNVLTIGLQQATFQVLR